MSYIYEKFLMGRVSKLVVLWTQLLKRQSHQKLPPTVDQIYLASTSLALLNQKLGMENLFQKRLGNPKRRPSPAVMEVMNHPVGVMRMLSEEEGILRHISETFYLSNEVYLRSDPILFVGLGF